MSHRNLKLLKGYDDDLETKRSEYFHKFCLAAEPCERRAAMRGMASLTSLRSATFISAYERSLGIPDE